MSRWGGRKVRQLALLVVEVKGSECWLCGLPGADSPDHDPPRSVLVRAGVPDPDDLAYLNPAHYLCNLWRSDRPVDDGLRQELRARRLALLDDDDTPLSPVIARRRPSRAVLFETRPRPGSEPFPVPPRSPRKNRPRRTDVDE
jgi:hypothetical protein